MSRRVGLRLRPDREADDTADSPGEAEVVHDERVDERRGKRGAPPDDETGDQPPALGATEAATPSE